MEDINKQIDDWELSEIMKCYALYLLDKRKLEGRKILNLRNKGIENIGLSYRIINHWEKNGLIDVERGENGNGWRKYSFMDQIWLMIIIELRSYGISIEKIKIIYNQLKKDDADYLPSVYPKLEFYIDYFIENKELIKILIYKDFTIEFGTKKEIEYAEQQDIIDSCITINLHKLIQNVLNKSFYKPNYNEEIKLSEKEIKLLYHLRIGNYKSVKVLFKDGKIERLEGEIIKVEKKIHEIMLENAYDEITITRENGEVVNTKRKIKIKL